MSDEDILSDDAFDSDDEKLYLLHPTILLSADQLRIGILHRLTAGHKVLSDSFPMQVRRALQQPAGRSRGVQRGQR
jgi:hypothetical protein|eukprot:COSAG03_NODE_614_length_6711_cov_6.683757_3_plen_76_part_00